MIPPPVKMIEAFRPLTPPEDVPAPKSDDEKFPTLESSTKEGPGTPSLEASLNEQGVSRPPTPPKDLAPLNPDNEKQAVTSEASTEVSTLKGSPEGSPKGKPKVTQDEKVQANVPKTFFDMVAEYHKDKADHYTPELVEKLEKMKAMGAAPMLNTSDTLESAKSTVELPGPALAPTGSAPPVPYFELSESTMEQHQATLGMSPRSKQYPGHKRYESENMSEYSTTSSVRQKKLFSEVVTSPGKKGGKASNVSLETLRSA